MRYARLVKLRRDNPHVIRQGARDLLDNLQPLGMDAVIVGAQDSHRRSGPFRSILLRQASSYPAATEEANCELACKGRLVPTFRSSCSIAAPAFTNFGKSWVLANILI